MAIIDIPSSSGTGNRLNPVNGNTYFQKPGAVLNSTDFVAIQTFLDVADDIVLIIGGTVTADSSAISMNPGTGGGTDLGVIVLDTGFIAGRAFPAIGLSGDGNYVINSGTILALGSNGIQLQGSNARVENHGSIRVTLDSGPASTGVLLVGAGTNNVLNTGEISVASADGAAITIEAIATSFVENHGSLAGVDRAVWDKLAGGVTNLLNTGSITGRVDLGESADSLTNSGLINGSVDMGTGTDTVVNAGQITGALTNAEVVSNSGTLEKGASLIGTGAQMTNSGEILSQMGVALTLTGNEAEVLNTGVITGDVNVIGNTAHLSNSGDVLGDIFLEGEGFNILNTGTVLASGFAISAGLNGTGGNQITNEGTLSGNLGIGIFGDQSSVTNTGTITAISNEGIYIEGSGIVISNTGDIHARGDGVTTVNLGSRLVNDGTIVSTSGDAVAGIQYMFNTGVISGQNLGYLGSSEADSLRNSGEINGTVSLGLGADRVVNWGKISDSSGFAIDMGTGTEADVVVNWGLIDGSVVFDAGADLYHGRGDGVVQGTVIGGGGMDTLRGSALDDSFDGGTDNDVLLGDGGDDTLLGDAGEDTVMGGAGADNIEGGNDNDRLFGGADNDVLIGGFGHDQLSGDMGDDTLSGDIGNDTLTGGSGNDAVDGGGGADLLYGNMGDDSIFGGSNAFSDTLYGGSGDDTLDGGDGVDFLYGGANDDRLIGGTNNDVLNGDWGNDTLIGGGGLDTINGGTGDDVLSGGANPDTFVFDRLNSGDDRITDFTNGLDLIDLQALGLSGYADLTGAGAVSSFDSGASTLIDLSLVGGDGTILMDGFAFANLNAADFVF